MTRQPIQETYHKLVTSQNFDLLIPHSDPKSWDSLSKDDRETLAKMFIMQGEKELESGFPGPLVSFDRANQLLPDDRDLLLRQAVAYATQSTELENLPIACEICEKILQKEPGYLPALTIYANTLVEIGLQNEDGSYFQRADKLYEKASHLPDFIKQPEPHLFWYWGLCWHYIARSSGEAADFVKVCQHYSRADELELSGATFWNDYGNVLVDLACLVDRVDYFEHASSLYQKVVDAEPTLYEGWFNLACTDEKLWELKGEERYFYSSHKAFEQAVNLNDEDHTLWFKWAFLLFETGKAKSSQKLIEASLDKFLKANAIKHDSPTILSRWAEAQMILGTMLERLDYLKWAELMIHRVIELEPENPEHWLVVGRVNIELGRYFEECEHLEKAVEKFSFGLSLDRMNPDLWHGLALSYHLMGRLTDSAEFLDKALQYYSRVTEFEVEMSPQFWNEWGVVLMKMGEITSEVEWIEMASEKFEHAIRLFHLHPGGSLLSADWFFNWGTALDILGDFAEDEKNYEKSIRALSQALVIDPSHLPAKFQLAVTFNHLGQAVGEVECFHRSIDLFEELAEEDPEDDAVYLEWGISLMHLAETIHDPAHAHACDKLVKEAEEKLTQSAALGNPLALYFLGCLHSWLNHFDLAVSFFERAHQLGALPPIEDLVHDEWLRELKNTPVFQQFVSRLSE